LPAALLLLGIGATGMTAAAAQGSTLDGGFVPISFGRVANDEVHDGQPENGRDLADPFAFTANDLTPLL
jgi:hypothetical protein